MRGDDFVAGARERSAPVWEAIHLHPFVKGIGDGTLSRSRWAFYLQEDYPYLVNFCRVLALALAKASGWEDMRFMSRLLDTTVNVEMELHLEACGGLGISLGELEKREPSVVTSAYANHLLRTAYEGASPDINAALLPCYAGYVEIAERLAEAGLPREPGYRAWIEAYVSQEMRENAAWLTRRMDEYAAGSRPEDRERWLDLYSESVRFELRFFDMCWES